MSLIEILVQGDWHFLQLVLSMMSYEYKRALMDRVNLNTLRDHIRTINSIFYTRVYNKFTYNSRRIKNNLPQFTSYCFISINGETLPAQFINFLRCYYHQPYPLVEIMPAQHIRHTHILFTYCGNTVLYIPSRRTYEYRGMEFEYIGSLLKCPPL